jgi:UDP-glucose 4-epimerase
MNIADGRFVITGGASLIGSHVADRLLAEGAREVVLLDNFSLGTPQAVAHLEGDARVKLVRGDILRINDLYDAFKGVDGRRRRRFRHRWLPDHSADAKPAAGPCG